MYKNGMNHYEKPHALQFVPPCVPSAHGARRIWHLYAASIIAPKVRQILHNMAQPALFSGRPMPSRFLQVQKIHNGIPYFGTGLGTLESGLKSKNIQRLKPRSLPLNAENPEHFRVRDWWGKVDLLICGKATAVASVHRTLAKSRLSNPSSQIPIPTKKVL